ncbi:DegV domain-containing protein [Corynebacterium deserti GIMN1.010]|uniref:DegV domain-containing protein n=1 Tax=Corynebacterium deserti GIMN1.010 TaxID=931089 RepID=A0A0M3QA15_9CORY|nr:DegV family protein [Corynebacterium deserti]ALC06513.1 DegV domain-containing protein [Corynebacterium deserti GIMN1.010]
MPVRVVVDSSACLPAEVALELDITIVELHVLNAGEDRSTSGLSSLELAATYARQLERGGDDGVLALHISKELSSTWSSAVTAAAVFADGAVRVVDTCSLGMAVGAAAMAAATLAKEGASLQECYDIAVDTLHRSETWVYLHRIDEIRKSGRISTATAVVSTALATRPIMRMSEGRMEIAAKTRTQSKAFAKLVELAQIRAEGEPVFVAIAQNEALEAAKQLDALLQAALPEGSSFMFVDVDPSLAVHAGPGALSVSAVFAHDLTGLSTGKTTSK